MEVIFKLTQERRLGVTQVNRMVKSILNREQHMLRPSSVKEDSIFQELEEAEMWRVT